nr:MAG TPA: hypothetical protein [Caudoviricetes sp.]
MCLTFKIRFRSVSTSITMQIYKHFGKHPLFIQKCLYKTINLELF